MESLVNYLSSISGVLEIVFLIISGLVGYIMKSQSNKIATLEDKVDSLEKEKLDRAEYRRDQDKLDATMKEMRDDIRSLPDRITNLITLMVSNTGK